MAKIPVQCPSCSARLGADERFEGRSARCPKCGATITVPSKQPNSDVVDAVIVESRNPSSAARPTQSHKATGPAIGIIVTALTAIPFQLYSLVNVLVIARWGNPSDGAMISSAVAVVLSIALVCVILYGAANMYQGQEYRLALITAYLTMTPCIGPSCFLGVPFGIWAITALGKDETKAVFGHTAK